MAKGFWNHLGEIVRVIKDFKGQELAEKFYKYLIAISCIIGFIISIFTKQFMYTGYAALVSTSLSMVLVFFPFPGYKKHPVAWVK